MSAYCLPHLNLNWSAPGFPSARRSVWRLLPAGNPCATYEKTRPLPGGWRRRRLPCSCGKPAYPAGHFAAALVIRSASPPRPDRDRVQASPPNCPPASVLLPAQIKREARLRRKQPGRCGPRSCRLQLPARHVHHGHACRECPLHAGLRVLEHEAPLRAHPHPFRGE